MKRRIEFRGMRVNKNQWVYGDFITGQGGKKGKCFILPQVSNLPRDCDLLDGYEVIPETVGQLVCSVKISENSFEDIYEGDLVVHGQRVLQVEVMNGNTVLIGKERQTSILLSFNDGKKVIGNIAESPDLLTN